MISILDRFKLDRLKLAFSKKEHLLNATKLRRTLCICTALLMHPIFANAQNEDVNTQDNARVVLKFVKKDHTRNDKVTFMQESCPPCKFVADPAFSVDNERESIVSLDLPKLRSLELRFHVTHKNSIKRVLLQKQDLNFNVNGETLTVKMPMVASDAVDAAEYATIISEPGMELRFEHADIVRRGGLYAEGIFPSVERSAANHFEFAQREVIKETGLGEYVAQENIGMIHVMGFDTNYPHGHTDAPPHMHMHMRWPNKTGTQIGHYYIDSQGLLTRNSVGIQNLGFPTKVFGRDELFITKDMYGRAVYSHKITDAGWLEIAKAGEKPCTIRPVSKGFNEGAIVQCPNHNPVTIHVTDDLKLGVIKVISNDLEETFRYDIDTGKLLSPVGFPSNKTQQNIESN